MKKKLTMLLLALVIAFGGTSVAMLSGCGSCDDTPPGPTETQYTVKFVGEDGTEIDSVTVQGGETVTAPAVPAKPGYTGKWVDADGNDADFTKGVTADAQYKAQYTANTDTEYTVEYYYETVEGGHYEKDDSKTETKTGTTDTTATVTATAEEGFEAATGVGEVLSGTIAGDGSLVLKVYYNRERYTVTFEADGETIDTKEVLYGGKVAATEEKVPSKDKTESTEYAFTHWSATEDGPAYNFDTTVTSNMTLYACYTQQTRHYKIDVELYVNNMYFLAMNAEGDAWIENADFNPASVEYEFPFTFMVNTFEEATGTAVVTVTKYDDGGTQISQETLEADGEGYYNVTVDRNMKIEVTGLTIKEYTVVIPVEMGQYEVDWAMPYTEDEIVLAITDANDQTTYHENALTTPVRLQKGVYTAAYVVDDGNDGYITLLTIPAFEVSALVANEEDTVTLSGEYVLTAGVTGQFVDCNYTEVNGVLSTDTPTIKNQMHYQLDFAPGDKDFALVATFKQDLTKENTESDPTFGYYLYGETAEGEGRLSVMLNATGLRLRHSANADVRGLLPGGNMLGKDGNGYDKITEVIVRKGDTFYYFLTGERTDGVQVEPVTNKLMAYANADGVYTCNGGFFADNGNIARLLAGGVTKVELAHEMSNPIYTDVYGYGYTYDAEVIDSYLAPLNATLNITGDITDEKALTMGSNTIELDLPEGKVVNTLTVNGEEVLYSVTENGIAFEVEVPFGGGLFDAVITLADGAYDTVVTGTVTYEGTPVGGAPVAIGQSYAYTAADGTFSVTVAAADSYTVTVTTNDYKPYIKTVEDISSPLDIKLEKPMMGGSVQVGSAVYSGGVCDIITGNAATSFERSFDEEGNEIYTSVATTPARTVLMYNGISSEQFIVKASFKYNNILDAYIRWCFMVVDENGNKASIGLYGDSASSTYNDWKNWNAVEKPPVSFLGNAQGYIDNGPFDIAMIYDKGNVKFYARCLKAWGEKWYLIHEGDMVANGSKPTGPVAVGVYETQNATSSFTISDFYASTDIEGNLVIDEIENGSITRDGETLNISAEEGYAVRDILFNGQSVLSDATVTATGYSYKLPNMWQLLETAEIEVVVVSTVPDSTITGTIMLGGSPLEGAAIAVKNADGITFTAMTGADGAFTVKAALLKEDAVLTISHAEILDKEIIVSETVDLGQINTYYAFRQAQANGTTMTTSGSIVVEYDKTAENPYESLELHQNAWNMTIAWNQRIAEHAIFGFTYEFAEGMSMDPDKDKDGRWVYMDEDVYLQHKFGNSSKNNNLRLMSNGQQEGLSGGEAGVASGNVFDLLGRNMKQLWSGQKWYSLSLMYVRDGVNLDVYATIPEVLDRYYYIGRSTAMPEGVMQFASWNSARGANGIFAMTMKDFYYSEDFSDITPNLATVENATISTDKATYANAEKATITVKAAEGYLVTAVTINGEKKAVEATGEYVLEYLALNPLGINVTAVETVAQSALVAVSGTVTIPEQYAEYYDVTGTVTYENENAVYVGEITDGKYTVNVAPGKYNVTVETKEFIAQDTAEVTAAAEGKDYALTTPNQGFFKTVVGVGLNYVDGKLTHTADGAPNDVSMGDITFVPNEQVVEFGYRLKGNMSGAIYPFYGFMVKQADAERMARLIYTFGAGDQVGFILKDDWASRLGASNEPWLLWKGGFIPGQKEGQNLTAEGTHNDDAWVDLEFKVRVDGYKFSLWIKGTNTYMHNDGQMKTVSLDDWTLCFENIDVYDRYANGGQNCADEKPSTEKLGQLYDPSKPCYFGVSHRQDNNSEIIDGATYQDFWFTITDK